MTEIMRHNNRTTHSALFAEHPVIHFAPMFYFAPAYYAYYFISPNHEGEVLNVIISTMYGVVVLCSIKTYLTADDSNNTRYHSLLLWKFHFVTKLTENSPMGRHPGLCEIHMSGSVDK